MSKENMDNFIPKNSAALCGRCKNHIPYTMTCKIYPMGIPKEYLGAEKTCTDRIAKE